MKLAGVFMTYPRGSSTVTDRDAPGNRTLRSTTNRGSK